MSKPLAFAVSIFIGSTSVAALEVRFVPGDCVIVNPTNRGAGYFDLVVHTVALATLPGESFSVEHARLDVRAGEETVASRTVPAARMIDDTDSLTRLPVTGLINAQFLHAQGAAGVFGRTLEPGASASLCDNRYLVTTRHHFSVDREPDALVVAVVGVDAEGHRLQIDGRLPVCPRRPAITYSFPLRGAWLMNAVPSIQSHHRLTPPTEFAVDFFKVEGGMIRSGDPARPESYFGYGQEVLAAADGVAVLVVNDVASDRAARVRSRAENPDAFFAAYVLSLQRDLLRGAAGNVVVLRHEGNGPSEFSTYGHLMEGSVRVVPGDSVRRGQVIGRVGDTGELIEPHLHFQINAGPRPLLDKSLPAAFADAQTFSDDLGQMVEPRGDGS